MIWRLGERLEELDQGEWEAEGCPAVFLTDSRNARKVLDLAGIQYENPLFRNRQRLILCFIWRRNP